MSKLLAAEQSRLFKSLIYKICLAFSIGLAVLCVILRWYDALKHADIYAKLGESYQNIDSLLLASPIYLLFVLPVFVGIFVGTEYSDGTIRNKMIVGHLRSDLYLSKLIVCSLADEILMFANIAVLWILGKLLVGGTSLTAAQFFAYLSVIFFATLSLTAILLLIAMSVQSKAAGSVSCILFVLIMMFSSLFVFQSLSAQEYIEVPSDVNISMDTEEADIVYEKEKNPRYLTGMKRQIYSTINDVLPFSQIYRFGMTDVEQPGVMIIYDCFILIFTAGIGIVILKKKNLK